MNNDSRFTWRGFVVAKARGAESEGDWAKAAIHEIRELRKELRWECGSRV